MYMSAEDWLLKNLKKPGKITIDGARDVGVHFGRFLPAPTRNATPAGSYQLDSVEQGLALLDRYCPRAAITARRLWQEIDATVALGDDDGCDDLHETRLERAVRLLP